MKIENSKTGGVVTVIFQTWGKYKTQRLLQLSLKKNNNMMIEEKIPKNGYFIAEILHVFSSQILLQKYLDRNICSIPNASKNFSEKSYK